MSRCPFPETERLWHRCHLQHNGVEAGLELAAALAKWRHIIKTVPCIVCLLIGRQMTALGVAKLDGLFFHECDHCE